MPRSLHPQSSPASPPHRPTILVVDDDPGLCDLLAAVLTEAGYACLTRHTPEAAVTVLHTSPVDLITTDSFSRTPAGIAAATLALRQAAGTTPVLLVTAHPLHERDPHACGFAGVLPKPFTLEGLLRRVSALVGVPAAATA